ncbi:M48 family metallopeptidase [Lacinutrix himadriensis]|uniref:M48 family metallopeptidase n=1 Tax=Lacinutrix himadriensis TaxID=641549 RepID=UPI0006E459A8|nr:M48 family metallopeptidase [Lacinutrix himadriensis]
MRTFIVTYFDGKSSKSSEATLVVFPQYWKISMDNTSPFSNSIRWDVTNIKSSKVYTKNIKSFSYGEYPFQYIECEDDLLIPEIEKHPEQKKLHSKVDTFLHQFKLKSIALLMLLIVGFSAGMYFYVIPNVAEKFAQNVNSKYVKNFGDFVFNTIKPELEINEERSKILQEFANQLDLKAEYPLDLYVVDEDAINAFAISGGKIVVYSGLLDKLTEANQLAALLGHEVSHINKRHVLKNVSRDLSGYIFLSVVFGDINGVTSVFIENAHLFKRMSYSRDLEQEADQGGLELLYANKVNPEGMIALFQVLKEETESEDFESLKYISSHPLINERITYTKEQIKEKANTFIENKKLNTVFAELQKK